MARAIFTDPDLKKPKAPKMPKIGKIGGVGRLAGSAKTVKPRLKRGRKDKQKDY